MDRIIAAKRTFQWINQELEKLKQTGANAGVIANLVYVNEELSDSIISLINQQEIWLRLNNSQMNATDLMDTTSEPTRQEAMN
jgi:hypothetical protein